MTKNKFARILVVTLLVSTLIVGQANANPKGVSLSPFEQTVTLQPTDTDKSFDLTLTNNTQNVQELLLSVHDFGSLNETGGLLFEGSSTYTQKYGLASWMTVGTDTVVLAAGESRSVPVTIENRANLQPGGHYGAVIATVNSLDPQTGNRVVINQQLVSLVLVDKVGGEHYDLKLAGISQNGNWLYPPTKVVLRFRNPGNVHVVPRGLVQLVSPTGTVISQGIINSESAIILPETYREFSVPLTRIAGGFTLPGVYRIKVSYRYDGITTSAHKQYFVKYINAPGILTLALVILFGLVYGIRKMQKNRAKKSRKPQKNA